MSEPDNIDTLCPPSPPSPVAKMKSRRSSTTAARRLSRASTMASGIMFEDLLATVPSHTEASCQERLDRLMQLVTSSSVRAAVEECKMDEENEELGDLANDVAMAIRRENVMGEDKISEVAEVIEKGVNVVGDNIGGDLKKMTDHTKNLEDEGRKWKELIAERKELYKIAGKNMELVKNGELVINDEMKWALSGEQRLKLTKIQELCKSAATQLETSNRIANLENLHRAISTAQVRQNTELRDNNKKLCQAVKDLTSRADLVGNKL